MTRRRAATMLAAALIVGALAACEPVPLKVMYVQASASRSTTPATGVAVQIDGLVSPGRPGRTVILQRKVGSSWSNQKTAVLDGNSVFASTFTPSTTGLHELRVLFPKSSTDAEAVSGTMRLYAGMPDTATCAKWASSAAGASDSTATNDGSQAKPWRTLTKLIATLSPGQHGCLPPGDFLLEPGQGVVNAGGPSDGRKITIRSGQAARATIRGSLELRTGVHDLILRDLNFREQAWQPTRSVHMILHGDRIELRDSDISFLRGICVQVGRIKEYPPSGGSVYSPEWADNVVIAGNRIHDCGTDPTITWYAADSGAHGVYLAKTRNIRVTDNLFLSNRWRGLQTWPDNEGALIARNLFDGNATQVNIGYDGPPSSTKYGWSKRTMVRDNIMTNRVSAFWPTDNPANIFAVFPSGSPFYGNQAFGNCIDQKGGNATSGSGVSFHDNPSVAAVTFVDRPNGDFRLAPGSACVGKGPASLQP